MPCIVCIDENGDITANNLSGTNTGDQTITLTGDVTGSGTGSFAATIEANAVTTTKIANDAVTFAKMQNITTDKLVGRDTAGSGDPEEISVGGGVEFTGSGAVQRSALTGDVTASAGSNSTTIANDAVTYAKMQDVSAASKLLGRGSASGSGNVEEITLGTGLAMSGMTLSASGSASIPPGFISGYILSNNTTDPTNDIDVTAGFTRASGNLYDINAAAMTKRLDANFSAGTGNGFLDTGSIANTIYAIYAIGKSTDASAGDYLASTSFTSPTMPATWDTKQLIGYIVRASGTILQFNQRDNLFLFRDAPLVDVNNTSYVTALTYTTAAISCPPTCVALVVSYCQSSTEGDGGGSSYNDFAWGARPVGSTMIFATNNSSVEYNLNPQRVPTDSSRQVQYVRIGRAVSGQQNSSLSALLYNYGCEMATRGQL